MSLGKSNIVRRKSTSKNDEDNEELSVSSTSFRSKRNPLVRSIRAKSTNSSTTTSGSCTKKSVDVHKTLFEEDELAQECLNQEGLNPIFLAKWILSKGPNFGSVYLLPYSSSHDDEPDGKFSDGAAISDIGYRYRIAGSTQTEKHFYTLSGTGLTAFLYGDVRYLTLDQWVSEYRNYERIRTIAFFLRFKTTKSFQTWKRVVKRQKFTTASQKLVESSCIFGNSKMRHCFLQVQSLVGKLTDMGVTEILPRKTYDLEEFFNRQLTLVADFVKNFGDFRNIVCQLVLDTCKATFSDAGFNYDEYQIEFNYTQKQLLRQFASRTPTASSASGSRRSSMTSMAEAEKPKPLTFMKQVTKRKVCENLVRFIRLIDFMMRYTAHMIVINSLVAIHKALVSRAKSRQVLVDAAGAAGASKDPAAAQVESDTEIPVFSCRITLQGKFITIKPELAKFEEGFQDLLVKLNEAVQSVPVLFHDPLFNPFTQPILYQKIENYKAESDNSPFIIGHESTCIGVLDDIKTALGTAFEVCDLEMEAYKPTAMEFSDVEKSEEGDHSQLVDVETDVDSLKSKLSNLTDQQALAKGIKDSQNVSIFRADFRPLKRTILPNISKTIIRLQDALPKLGREKMENFNEDCKSLKDMIEFELKTSEDYVNNMDIKEKMQSRFDQLHNKLEAIENVYQIMKNIPVPVSTEDKNSLKNLKSQLKGIGNKVQEKIKVHADILERFAETLEREQLALRETVASILSEVRSPALLELEATADEVKPTLAKIEQMLKHASSKVLQYNQYEKKYGLSITAYLELVAAEHMLAAINTVWKCTEDWETLYTKWASVEFSQLDVDDCEEGTALIELEIEEAKEVIGASPMSQDLMNKVFATTQRLPVLKDLRTPALKERHWKQISEVVGADLTASGKKITMEVLDKYNVFNYGAEIARIVKAAAQEEQLDCMVNELRNTWTDRKLSIKVCHGVPTVCDFNSLHATISSSVCTLKELGQSRYSSEMKDSLLYWCDVVERADFFVQLLAKTQSLWMFQEVPMTSMLIQDKHPSKFEYFKLLRTKFKEKMTKIAAAENLITAFGDNNDYLQLIDIATAFKETDSLLVSVLWSLRSDSSRLFFLAKSDLLHMLFEAHNDLPALYKYIDRIYPALSSLVLVEGTDLTVNRKGYHPEIKGIISKDGETVWFSEIMKVRLGVEHWVKCIGLHLRFTLRAMARGFDHTAPITVPRLTAMWKEDALSTHIFLLCIHSSVCRLLHEQNSATLEEIREAFEAMRAFSVNAIKMCGLNEVKKSREVTKLLFVEYYLDLLGKAKTTEEFDASLLVKYTWEEERRIFKVSELDDKYSPYGYEYNGQCSLLNPGLAYDKAAYNILTGVASGRMCILQQDIRKTQLRTISMIYGRPFFFASSGTQDNFKEVLIGAVITNTWIYIQVDDHNLANLNFLKTLTVKLEIARKFNEEYLEIMGQEVELGKSGNIFIARTSLLNETAKSRNLELPATTMFNRFRHISLVPMPVMIKIRMALLARGVSDRGLGLFLCIMIERFFQLEDEKGPQCLELKIINAIKLSINSGKLGIIQKFLNQGLDAEALRIKMSIDKLVLDNDVYDIIKKQAKMASEFKNYFEDFKNPSMVAAATSQAMVENCMLLQSSISNFSMTCAVFNGTTNTVRRTIRATTSFLHGQTGCIVYDVCAQTQLNDNFTMAKILSAASETTGVLNVFGKIHVKTISMLRSLALEYTTLKILFSCHEKDILSKIDKYVNCVRLQDDLKYNLLTAMSSCLNEKFFAIFDKHFSMLFPYLHEVLLELQNHPVEARDGCLVLPSEKSFALIVGTALADISASQDLGSMLNSAELVIKLTRESIFNSLPVLTSGDETAQMKCKELFKDLELTERQQQPHPVYGKKISGDSFTPQIRVSEGNADFFVPTTSIMGAIQAIDFFMGQNASVMLLGPRGCGKSLAFAKVMPHLPKGTSVKYLILGESNDFTHEVSILRELTAYKSNIVVIENFQQFNHSHVHFVLSLLLGRIFYDERRRKFDKLPTLTLFVEVDCQLEEIPPELLLNMVVLRMVKEEEANMQILKDTFATVQGNLPQTGNWEELANILWTWHRDVKGRHKLISDHILYRAFSGILSYLPDELESHDVLLKFIYYELLQEYSSLVDTDTVVHELEQIPAFANVLAQNEDVVFLYQNSSSLQDEGVVNCHVEATTMKDTLKKLNHVYHSMRGKSYNDRLVFSAHYVEEVLSLVRALCRYGTLALLGPKGCGKKSAVTFCAQMLDLELVICPKDFNELVTTLKENYIIANNENHKLLLVEIDEESPHTDAILDLLNKIFFYYDIPNVFNKEQKMAQLFDESHERFEALLDPSVMTEATNGLTFRIKEHFHVVVAMTLPTFERVYPHFINFFLKSGIVRMTDWPEETLIALAEDRFLGLEKDITTPIRTVSKTCSILHLDMLNEPLKNPVASTQYLDMVKILPLLLRPLQKKLLRIRNNLKTGIDQVHKANTFINKLTNEISEKEPEVLRLNSEIEQLNKRLSQERINLERASKAFRKKEVAARKKSEETQDLAADAHRNLEHALPSLDAALQAVNAIDKGELMELKAMKNPSELAQQVLEAVCILLGLKADWQTAKMVMSDAQFIQRLTDFDKDNISEQISKRIRRYIDNQKFIPDEVAKVSRACCALCMWVRAIDLYAKIFKSIEPKRIRLLQAESELAEAMAALREETDRVAHIESTITSIQSNCQERIKRRANLEATIKQTADRLERAQLLSYSLEEESERWKSSLIQVEKNLQVLVGNSVVAAMIVAYSGCLHQNERRICVDKWRAICSRNKLETSVIPANDFLAPIMTPLKHWTGKFEFYCENYLSMRISNKWPLIHDPHGLALEAMKAQNDNLVVIGMNDERLVDVLRQAISKGHEVLVHGFKYEKVTPGLVNVFHRKMTERIHAFVGLMGIPIMRKDQRVIIDGQEVVSNQKFRLFLLSSSVPEEKLFPLKNLYNIIIFDYIAEALELQLLKITMSKIDLPFCKKYEETVENIRHLDHTVMERKDNVLEILLKSDEDVLDDKSVVVSLKDAKAKVFEILNDLNQEKKEMKALEEDLPEYKRITVKLRCLLELLDLMAESESPSPLPKIGFIKLIESIQFSEDSKKFLPVVVDKVLSTVLPSLQSKNRYILQLSCNIILTSKSLDNRLSSRLERCITQLFNIPQSVAKWEAEMQRIVDDYLETCTVEDHENNAVLDDQIKALLVKDGQAFGRALRVEQSLITTLKQQSEKMPMLVYVDASAALDAVDVISDMARSGKFKSPQFISGDTTPSKDIATQMINCKKEQRWLVVDNFQNVARGEVLEAIPTVNGNFRLFLLTHHGAKMPSSVLLYSKVSSISLTHAPESLVRRPLYFSLLTLRGSSPKAKTFYDGILTLHEYMVESNPKSDQYRFISALARKWLQHGITLSPFKLQTLLSETYGYSESSESHDDELLLSTLREIASYVRNSH